MPTLNLGNMFGSSGNDRNRNGDSQQQGSNAQRAGGQLHDVERLVMGAARLLLIAPKHSANDAALPRAWLGKMRCTEPSSTKDTERTMEGPVQSGCTKTASRLLQNAKARRWTIIRWSSRLFPALAKARLLREGFLLREIQTRRSSSPPMP